MKHTKHNKLVRDKIPEILEKEGQQPLVRYLNETDFWAALTQKLEEEILELKEASEPHHITEELADILEVIYALAQANGISPEELERQRRTKKSVKGGFEKRVFLISPARKQ